jgi:hypothetical protein
MLWVYVRLSRRLYTNWDIYVAINQSLGILVVLRTWWEALADMSVLKHSWNIHSNVLLWCVLNIITLTLIFRCASYPCGLVGGLAFTDTAF